jgi:2,4-dienoyl-CoA reductase-like NADH-dependent reductase (Old Yellow Enzyme family)
MLFTPIKIGQLTLPGRFIKTATSETRASDDGFVTDELLDFYLPIAAGGTPLIITGNFYTSIDGKSTPRQPGADHDDKLPALARLVSAVHQHGAKIFAQLSHCGRQVVPRFAGLPEAVSASDVKDLITGTRPRPLCPGTDEPGKAGRMS